MYRKAAKKADEATNFIGSFAAGGMSVAVSYSGLIKKLYLEGEARDESNVEDAEIEVDVKVTK